MRLDLFLKHSRLIPRRTVAKRMCDAGAVLLNQKEARSSSQVKPNDVLTIKFRGHTRVVGIVTVPAGQMPKKEAVSLYRVISETRVDPLKEA